VKLTISKEKLLKFVQLAEAIVSSKTNLSILSNLLLETSENSLQITSTDLEILIKSNVEAEVQEQGSITVLAKKFVEVIKELPNDDIEIDSSGEDNYIKIQSKSKEINAKFRIIGLPKDDFPELPDFKKDKNMILDQKILKAMIRKTIIASSSEGMAGNLNGIKLELENENLRMVATDTRRLSLINYKLKGQLEIEGIIIPQKVLFELLKILGEEGIVEISVDEKQIFFKIDNIEIISRLIDGTFPDYNTVLPKSFEKNATIITSHIADAVRRVSVMADNKYTSKIVLDFSKNNMNIFSESSEIGNAKETIDIEYEQEDFKIAFSSDFLTDALKVIDTEKIIIKMNANVSPIIIYEENNENFTSLIMPIRID
jgi:DNA polymerase-3 subunit beta